MKIKPDQFIKTPLGIYYSKALDRLSKDILIYILNFEEAGKTACISNEGFADILQVSLNPFKQHKAQLIKEGYITTVSEGGKKTKTIYHLNWNKIKEVFGYEKPTKKNKAHGAARIADPNKPTEKRQKVQPTKAVGMANFNRINELKKFTN